MVASGLLSDEPVERLEGVLVRINAQGPRHTWVLTLLHRHLTRLLPERYLVVSQAPLAASDVSEPEPDLAVVDVDAVRGTAHPSSAHLVVEVAATSPRKDLTHKARDLRGRRRPLGPLLGRGRGPRAGRRAPAAAGRRPRRGLRTGPPARLHRRARRPGRRGPPARGPRRLLSARCCSAAGTPRSAAGPPVHVRRLDADGGQARGLQVDQRGGAGRRGSRRRSAGSPRRPAGAAPRPDRCAAGSRRPGPPATRPRRSPCSAIALPTARAARGRPSASAISP